MPDFSPAVIYGQDVRYAASGHAYRDVGGRPRLEQAVEEARSRDGQDVRYAASGQEARSRPAKAGIQAGGWDVRAAPVFDGLRDIYRAAMPAWRAGLV